jgi:hypothetical protein
MVQSRRLADSDLEREGWTMNAYIHIAAHWSSPSGAKGRVELKRPTVTGGEEIVAQVKKYARALAANPRWTDTKTTWTFWAVTYELDSFGLVK